MKDIAFKTIMLKGESGSTITKIEKTSSALNVDTYTIYLNDGNTTTFEVTNGSSIESIEKTATSGYIDTYTVTLTDGSTSTFTVRNGEDGASYDVPADAVLYMDNDDPAPEGYQSFGDLLTVAESSAFNTTAKTPVGAVNELAERIPTKLKMVAVGLAFSSGVASISFADLGLTGATIRALIASPVYASSSIGANCYCTCQILTNVINVYIRDGVSNSVPADATYYVYMFISYV